MPLTETALFDLNVTSPFELDGFAAAVKQESLVREAAFLVNRERIGPFMVRPMDLIDYSALRIANSPMIKPFRTPTHEELIAFLWRLHPSFSPDHPRARRSFVKKCRVLVAPLKPKFRNRWTHGRWLKKSAKSIILAAKVLADAREYIEETMQDAPRGGDNTELESICDSCSIIARLARAYGWPEAFICKMPLKRVFQYLRECREADHREALLHGLRPAPVIHSNRSSDIIDAHLAEANSQN